MAKKVYEMIHREVSMIKYIVTVDASEVEDMDESEIEDYIFDQTFNAGDNVQTIDLGIYDGEIESCEEITNDENAEAKS